ncbi:succinyltransferase component of 2-oxoglutarate dehydrogenase complex, partial [Galemys pyrenaicus]
TAWSWCVSKAFHHLLSTFQKGNCSLRRCFLHRVSVCKEPGYPDSRKIVINNSSIFSVHFIKITTVCKDDVASVKSPAFAESVTEGNVSWEKAVGDNATSVLASHPSSSKLVPLVKPTAAPLVNELRVGKGLPSEHQEKTNRKHNLKKLFISAFVKSLAYTLLEQPVVNAMIDNVKKWCIGIRQHQCCSGHTKGSGGSQHQECGNMDGGNFTFSNGGIFHSPFGTPILKPHNSAILSMHDIFDRLVVVGNKLEMHP